MADAKQLLIAELRGSLEDLVEHYGGGQIELPSSTKCDGVNCRMSASVGFGVEGICGSIVLLTDATEAKQLGGEPESCLSDWLGELANQLVGRFKNKMTRYGLLIKQGLPVRLKGKELALSGGQLWIRPVQWRQAWMFVVADMEVQPDLILEYDETAASAEEGSISLF